MIPKDCPLEPMNKFIVTIDGACIYPTNDGIVARLSNGKFGFLDTEKEKTVCIDCPLRDFIYYPNTTNYYDSIQIRRNKK